MDIWKNENVSGDGRRGGSVRGNLRSLNIFWSNVFDYKDSRCRFASEGRVFRSRGADPPARKKSGISRFQAQPPPGSGVEEDGATSFLSIREVCHDYHHDDQPSPEAP